MSMALDLRNPTNEMTPGFVRVALWTARSALAFAVRHGAEVIPEYERGELASTVESISRLVHYLGDDAEGEEQP